MRLIQGGWPFNHPPNMPFTINLESPQADGLVLWMPLGPNAAGEPYVDRVGRRQFSENGTPVWVVDERGWSLLFDDGSNEYLSYGSAVLTDMPLTISAWFNTDTNGNQQITYMSEGDAGNAYSFRVATGLIVRARYSEGFINENADSTTTFSLNTWNHGCAIFESASSRSAFLNGGNKGTNVDVRNTITPVNTYIGSQEGTGIYFSGQLSDIRIYNRALTDQEVRALYDPATRWQLYQPVVPNFAVAVTAVGPIAQAVAGAITPAGALLKLIGTDKAGVTGPSGATVKETATSKLGTLTFAGVLGAVKAVLQALTGAIGPSGTLTKQVGKVLAGTLTSTGALVRDIAAVLAGIVGPGGAVVKETATSKLGTLSFAGALAGIKAVIQAIAGAIGPSGTLSVQVGKVLSGTLTSAGALIKQIGKGLAGVVDAVGAPGKGLTTSLGGVLSFAGALTGTIGAIAQAVGGVIGPSGTLTRQVGKGLAGVVDTVGAAGKGLTTSLGGILSFSGTVAGVLAGAFTAVVDLTLKTRDITLTLKDRIITFLAINDR